MFWPAILEQALTHAVHPMHFSIWNWIAKEDTSFKGISSCFIVWITSEVFMLSLLH